MMAGQESNLEEIAQSATQSLRQLVNDNLNLIRFNERAEFGHPSSDETD
jgi:hypothetical protein